MTLYAYAFYNRKVGAYTAPMFEQYDKELKTEIIKRGYVMAKDDDRANLDECDFYYLGKFDDVKGSFDLLEKPEFILSFGGKDDVRKEN